MHYIRYSLRNILIRISVHNFIYANVCVSYRCSYIKGDIGAYIRISISDVINVRN